MSRTIIAVTIAIVTAGCGPEVDDGYAPPGIVNVKTGVARRGRGAAAVTTPHHATATYP